MDREQIEDRIYELNILLSGAQSLEEAEYINRLIRDLEIQLDELERDEDAN